MIVVTNIGMFMANVEYWIEHVTFGLPLCHVYIPYKDIP